MLGHVAEVRIGARHGRGRVDIMPRPRPGSIGLSEGAERRRWRR